MTARGRQRKSRGRQAPGRGRGPADPGAGGRARRGRWVARLALVSGVAAGGVGLALAAQGRGLRDLAPADLTPPDVGAALRAPRFHLTTVDFLGLVTLRAEDLVARAKLTPETPLIDVEPGAVCARLLALPRVAHCAGTRVPPRSLIVALEERVPLAALGAGAMGIDGSGERFPLAPEEAGRLPRVSGRAELALPLLRAARAAGVTLDRVSAPEPGGLAFVPPGRDTRVRVGRDPERALRDWGRLAASGLVESRGAREVDLRFRGGAVLRDFGSNEGGTGDGSP